MQQKKAVVKHLKRSRLLTLFFSRRQTTFCHQIWSSRAVSNTCPAPVWHFSLDWLLPKPVPARNKVPCSLFTYFKLNCFAFYSYEESGYGEGDSLQKGKESYLGNKSGESKLNQQEEMFHDQNSRKSGFYAPIPLLII